MKGILDGELQGLERITEAGFEIVSLYLFKTTIVQHACEGCQVKTLKFCLHAVCFSQVIYHCWYLMCILEVFNYNPEFANFEELVNLCSINYLQLMFLKLLLGARHWSKHFSCVFSFNPQNNALTVILLPTPFCRRRD